MLRPRLQSEFPLFLLTPARFFVRSKAIQQLLFAVLDLLECYPGHPDYPSKRSSRFSTNCGFSSACTFVASASRDLDLEANLHHCATFYTSFQQAKNRLAWSKPGLGGIDVLKCIKESD